MSYNLGPVKPHVAAAANELGPKFGIKTIGGYRSGARDPNGHPAGLALDLMTTNGGALADYARANARRLGILYVIWNQRIWSAARNGDGWRPMADRGSATQNHKDHVHISFTASPGTGGAAAGAAAGGAAASWSTSPPVPQAVGAPSATNVGFGVAGADFDLTDQLVKLAIYATAIWGGVILIGVGAAAIAKPHAAKTADQAKSSAMAALSVLPQGKAATAAAAATKGATR